MIVIQEIKVGQVAPAKEVMGYKPMRGIYSNEL